jgi:hypothetical protein
MAVGIIIGHSAVSSACALRYCLVAGREGEGEGERGLVDVHTRS